MRLFRDTAGNVLPMAAMGVIIGALIIGAAVDTSRNYLAREQLQSACDAATLAGRRTVTTGGFDTASEAAANLYFSTNFKDSTQGTRSTSFKATSDDDGKTVSATASTVLDTVIMRIFGYDTFNISVTCASSMGVGNADVMMVLDTTGSMTSSLSGSTRIAALRTAMKNFYTTMTNATADTNARVRYGFVPYSTTVNVGNLLNDLDTRYLADTHDYQSREYVTTSPVVTYSSVTGPTSYSKTASTTYTSQALCIAAYPSTTNPANTWVNNGSASTTNTSNSPSDGITTTKVSQGQRMYEYMCQSSTVNRQTVWTVYGRYYTRTMYTTNYGEFHYHKIAYDTSIYKTFAAVNSPTGTRGAAVSSTWNGCILERATVAKPAFSYSSITGISPSGAYDLDLDSPPKIGDVTTQWAPMWPSIAYRRYDGNSNYTTDQTIFGASATSYCPAKAQLLTEMSETAFNTYADSLVAEGSTYLDTGIIWGGRLLSPQGIFSSNVNDEAANGGEVSRHLIFMTDGIMEPNYLINQAWGMEYWDRNVTDDGYTNDAARHTQRFLAACEAIKDKGIRIWVIAFTSGLSTDLKTCATDNSSYTANSASALNTAFQEIAKQVGELRVVK